jgi:hypothetical protein
LVDVDLDLLELLGHLARAVPRSADDARQRDTAVVGDVALQADHIPRVFRLLVGIEGELHVDALDPGQLDRRARQRPALGR